MTDWPDEAESSLVSLKVCFDADKRMEYRCSLRPVPKSTQGFISIAETVRRLFFSMNYIIRFTPSTVSRLTPAENNRLTLC